MVFDFLIIGAGIAGASVAAELASEGSVLLAEQEDQPGTHATGRSAALYAETYGNAVIRALTTCSRPAFETATADGTALLRSRGCLHVADAGRIDTLDGIEADGRRIGVRAERLTPGDVIERVPVMRADYVAGGVLEPDAMDIDVNALHRGFLRRATSGGATVRLGAPILELLHGGREWLVVTGEGAWRARTVVNAAGAWADTVATLAGVQPRGLVPLRRTAVLLDAPEGHDVRGWPAVLDAGERFYFKPEAGKILASPADETPSEACDAQPDELDIAICIDRLQSAADIPVRRVSHAWAGLRTFAPDRTPVVGFDPIQPGFFWLAGQGGYGIQTAPALARVAAALLTGGRIPRDAADSGVTAEALSPSRFARQPAVGAVAAR